MERKIPVDPVLEHGYDVRMLRDDFAQISEGWIARSKAFRESTSSHLDCVYGDGDRDKLDVFLSGTENAPLFVFIHGGYWQRGDKSVYSFVADSFVQSGIDVALIGYELCPDASMSKMFAKIQQALIWLWRHADDVNISRDRINISGHSAGGHLTGMVMTTKWSELENDLPDDLIKSGIPISGLYQLEPLLHTTISDALHLTDDEVQHLSPHYQTPATNAPILVTLGGAETPQFHWQADQFMHAWKDTAVKMAHHAEPDVDHFDVLNRLADTGSEIFKKTHAWIK